MDKDLELTMKSLTGDLTVDEAQYLSKRNTKYELVRYFYMEKMKYEGSEIKQFHFTPGDNFMETPVIDIVNELFKVMQSLKDGNYEAVDFEDLDWKHNPPHSGKEKTTL